MWEVFLSQKLVFPSPNPRLFCPSHFKLYIKQMVNDNECDYYDTFLAPCQKVSFVTLHFPRPSIALCFPLDFISSLLSTLLAPYFPGPFNACYLPRRPHFLPAYPLSKRLGQGRHFLIGQLCVWSKSLGGRLGRSVALCKADYAALMGLFTGVNGFALFHRWDD